MSYKKLEPFEKKQTPWFGVWYDNQAHGFSSCVLKLSDLRKFKGDIRIYLKKNKFYNNGENGRPNYCACIKDAESENPFELTVLDKSEHSYSESEEKIYTRSEVLSILEGLYSYEKVQSVANHAVEDGRQRGYSWGDVLVEDYVDPITPEDYLTEWEENNENNNSRDAD